MAELSEMSETSQAEVAARRGGDQKYWAFISYSQRDEKLAKELHRWLETYRIPKDLVGQTRGDVTVPRRLLPVFRDRDELGSGPDVDGELYSRLDRSRNLIVVCTPNSAASEYVNREVTYFKSLGRGDRTICLIAAGEPPACFPPAVRSRADVAGESKEAAPLAADMRRGKDGPRDAKLKLLAAILKVDFDELKQRDRRRQRNRRLWQAAASAGAVIGLVLLYVLLADWDINIPGGERVRTAIDRRQASLLRPVPTDEELRRAAASQRRALFDALKRERTKDGWAVDKFGERQQASSAWTHAQRLFVVFSTPEATNEELREFLPALELCFVPGVAQEFKGVKYGWTPEVVEGDGRGWKAGTHEDAQAVPALWTAAAVAAALARPGLIEGDERGRFESYFRYAEGALRLYRPLETGGWNLYPYQKDPALHEKYTSALALLALLEARRANLAWEGSAERRDALLCSTARWLVDNFDAEADPPGWRGSGDEASKTFDGLTLQIYSTLLRAEAEAGCEIPPVVLAQIPRHLAGAAKRDLTFPVVKGEHIATIADPNTGREYRGRESIGFLWHPWLIDCSVRWLERAKKHGAAPEDVAGVRRALGRHVVELGEAATRRVTSDWVFHASETLYGLSAVR